MDAQKRIRVLMEEHGRTDYRLEKEASLPHSTVTNMFNRNNAPMLPTLQAVCIIIGARRLSPTDHHALPCGVIWFARPLDWGVMAYQPFGERIAGVAAGLALRLLYLIRVLLRQMVEAVLQMAVVGGRLRRCPRPR